MLPRASRWSEWGAGSGEREPDIRTLVPTVALYDGPFFEFLDPVKQKPFIDGR